MYLQKLQGENQGRDSALLLLLLLLLQLSSKQKTQEPEALQQSDPKDGGPISLPWCCLAGRTAATAAAAAAAVAAAAVAAAVAAACITS